MATFARFVVLTVAGISSGACLYLVFLAHTIEELIFSVLYFVLGWLFSLGYAVHLATRIGTKPGVSLGKLVAGISGEPRQISSVPDWFVATYLTIAAIGASAPVLIPFILMILGLKEWPDDD